MALSLDAARRVLQHVGRLLLLRADLAAEEWVLARRQWVVWLCTALAAIALLVVALVAAGAWLTLVLWDRFGAVTVGALALVFGALAAFLVRSVIEAASTAPAPMAQTRAALRDDYEALAGAVVPERKTGPHE